MPAESAAPDDKRVLLVPPTRRDGEVTCELLRRAQVHCVVCEHLGDVGVKMQEGVGAILLTEHALTDRRMGGLLAVLQRQPTWSDIPVVVLTREGTSSEPVREVIGQLTNVTVLDRPASTRSMVSAVLAALRARGRQYQIREQLFARQRAEQALRDADQRKDEFLATLAHELRNPLAPIRTGLHVLDQMPGDSQQAVRTRAMMGRQLVQLVKLIDELLEVSRIATGKVVLQRERLDLRSTIGAALEACQPGIQGARHRVQLRLPSAPVWVVGDPGRLVQVVSNLLTNAAKYTPDGGDIVIDLQEHQGVAVLRVSDNGVGIPSELLEQVFDIFTQVNRNLDRAQGGLGIGLSLVRRLLALHGGSIEAQSAGLDCGSTFIMRIPAVTARERAPATNGPLLGSSVTGRRLRVLVVDDNQDAADTLTLALSGSGHTTRTEYDGAAALATAAEFQPEVVFCDLGMPGIDGHEVARRLRADRRNLATVLVAVTGWGSDEEKRLTKSVGFDYHLVKPVGPEMLDLILARL